MALVYNQQIPGNTRGAVASSWYALTCIAEFQIAKRGSSSMLLSGRRRFNRIQRWASTNACKASGASGRFSSILGKEVEPRTCALVSISQRTWSNSEYWLSSRYSTSTRCNRPWTLSLSYGATVRTTAKRFQIRTAWPISGGVVLIFSMIV